MLVHLNVHAACSSLQVELALRVQLDYLEGQLAISTDNDQESNIYTYRYGHATHCIMQKMAVFPIIIFHVKHGLLI